MVNIQVKQWSKELPSEIGYYAVRKDFTDTIGTIIEVISSGRCKRLGTNYLEFVTPYFYGCEFCKIDLDVEDFSCRHEADRDSLGRCLHVERDAGGSLVYCNQKK